jgi:hypothetical protein
MHDLNFILFCLLFKSNTMPEFLQLQANDLTIIYPKR